jgi:four helix bundle protein
MNAENETPTTPRDIDERALEYGIRAVRLFQFIKSLKEDAALIMAKQYLRSATSIGANLAEARAGETRRDFIHKCSIAQKEARESCYWLRLMAASGVVPSSRLSSLLAETNEIIAVITAILRNAKRSSN